MLVVRETKKSSFLCEAIGSEAAFFLPVLTSAIPGNQYLGETKNKRRCGAGRGVENTIITCFFVVFFFKN